MSTRVYVPSTLTAGCATSSQPTASARRRSSAHAVTDALRDGLRRRVGEEEWEYAALDGRRAVVARRCSTSDEPAAPGGGRGRRTV